MPQIASPGTYFLKIFRGACPQTPLGARALWELAIHSSATLAFGLTTSRSVENTVHVYQLVALNAILFPLC